MADISVSSHDRWNPFDSVWYPVVNDLIGGWAISLWNKPMSQHNHNEGEGDIADFMMQDVAEYICNLHNKALFEEKLRKLHPKSTEYEVSDVKQMIFLKSSYK
jgi:hypothetical protein